MEKNVAYGVPVRERYQMASITGYPSCKSVYQWMFIVVSVNRKQNARKSTKQMGWTVIFPFPYLPRHDQFIESGYKDISLSSLIFSYLSLLSENEGHRTEWARR